MWICRICMNRNVNRYDHCTLCRTAKDSTTPPGTPTFIVINDDNYVQLKSNIILSCYVNANPKVDYITWTKIKDGKQIDFKDCVPNYSKYGGCDTDHLEIFGVDHSDTGEYICTARNEHGIGKSQPIALHILEDKPQLHVAKTTYDVKFKSFVTLSCAITAHPEVLDIGWIKLKNEREYGIEDQSSKYCGIKTGNLTITDVDENDAGEYICKAVNKQGKALSNPITVKVFGDMPKVDAAKTKYDVKFKSLISLSCTITANPEVIDISWIKRENGREINIRNHFRKSSKYYGIKTENITITDIDDNDAGEYICKATNKQGTGESHSITIKVIGGLQDIRNTIRERKPKLEDLKKSKKEEQMSVSIDLKIGIEIAFGKIKSGDRYVYKHHGIVTSICDISKTFEIIELIANDTPGNFSSAISSSRLKPKIMKNCVQFQANHLFCYRYVNCSFADDIIKERAEILFRVFAKSGVHYNLYNFNCEHFASYCATGVAFSRQVSDVNSEATDKLDELLIQYIDGKLNSDRRSEDSCLIM